MEALGDFGGFNDGVMLFPAIFMSFYSNKMFQQTLFSLLPIKKGKRSSSGDTMKEKCDANQSLFTLTEKDAEVLADESGRMILKKNSWLLSLCFSKCICKRERGMRLQAKAIEAFENQLDIRSIVKTRTDLSILLRSLLSKEQLLLFHNQHSRAIATCDSSDEKEVGTRSNDEPEDDFIDQNLYF